MHLPSLLHRFPRPTALFALALSALGLTTTARAITNDELIPANLIGKSITLTHAAGAPNRLEATINSYTITFTTASTFTRAATGFSSSGTYKVNSSAIAGSTGVRNTFLEFTGWYATGNTAPVSVNLGHSAGECRTPTRMAGRRQLAADVTPHTEFPKKTTAIRCYWSSWGTQCAHES